MSSLSGELSNEPVVTAAPPSFHFLVLADESAEWKIAGLTQLDRIVLAVNEFCSHRTPAHLQIFRKPGLALTAWVPPAALHVQVETVQMPEVSLAGTCLLDTHLLIDRGGLANLCEASLTDRPESNGPEFSWDNLAESFRSWCTRQQDHSHFWRLIRTKEEIAPVERVFLRGAGKSQDGLVSRFLNRPISRSVTRILLRYPITPTQWTIAIFVLPIISFFLLERGNYGAMVIGAILFQLFSILDGCDGEIARAKYLESKRGGQVDHLCDQAGNILFLAGLGLGLFHIYKPALISLSYWREAIFCAALITVHELILGFSRRRASAIPSGLDSALYRRHRWMIEHSGIGLFGERFVWWLVQLTKRDVSILFFLLLVIIGLAQWILHLWLTVTLVSFILTGVATWRARRQKISTG